MKKLLALGCLALCAASITAQMTTVTATVVDSDGTAWQGGKWTLSFNPAPGYPNIGAYTINGAPLVPSIANQSGTMNGLGVLTLSTYDSTQISPIRSGWVLQVCPQATAPCGSYIFSTAGSSMNISSNLTAVIPAPRFIGKNQAYGYADVEAMVQVTIGSEYYNVNSLNKRCYDGTSWAVCSGSGSGNVSGQSNGVIPLGTAPTSITQQSHLDDGVTAANTITSARAFSVPNNPITGLQIGGSAYVKQYGNLTTTGISTCALAGVNVCVADPTYGITEQYAFTNMIPNVPNQFIFQDQRQGMTQYFVHNFPYPRNATFSGQAAGFAVNCLQDAPYGQQPTALYGCSQVNSFDNGPGISKGNSAVAVIGGTQWQVATGLSSNLTSAGAGIREAFVSTLAHTGIGDTATSQSVNNHGGARATSDEGLTNDIITSENTNQFRGTVTSGGTTGSQLVKTTPTNFAGEQGVRCCIIDTTQGPTANTITNLAAGLSGTLEAVTFGTPVTASVFWGTLVANVQPNGADLSAPPYGTVLTFSVNATSGVPVVTAGQTDPNKFCFASQFDDPVIITNVTGSGPYTLTALVGSPHAAGSVVMQGPMCSSGLELLANTPTGANPNRYLADIIGCISTTVCEVTFFRLGSGSSGPFVTGTGNFSSNIYATGSVTGLSSNGTTVYATGATGLIGFWNKTNVIFAGASDSALNTTCLGVTFIVPGSTSFTCTIAGLTGTHTATTATFQLANGAGTVPLNSVNIWPKATVLDVQDYANSAGCTALHLAPVCVDGTFAMAPNNIPFATNDSLTETNDEALLISPLKNNSSAQNPWSLYQGITIGMGGTGAQGGSISGNSAINIPINQADTTYVDSGGTLTPVDTIKETGPYFDWLMTDHTPSNGRSMFSLASTTNQKNNPNYFYQFLLQPNLSGGNTSITLTPFLGDMALLAGGQLGLGGTAGNVQFNSNINGAISNDRIQFAKATAPTCTVAQGPGTGTLADGTYGYRIAVRNNASGGPGIPGTECTGPVANGGNNSAKVTWTRGNGADVAYYIYGRTPLYTLSAAANASAGTTTYTGVGLTAACTTAGMSYLVAGFVTGANNGTFTCVSSTSTTLVLNNASGVAETHAATAGGELQMANVSSNVLAFVDNGSVPPSGAIPTTDATLGFVDQASKLCANSSGTTFEGCIVAPAAYGSTQTFTLPAAGGTLAVSTQTPTKITNSITPAAATASQCAEQTFTYTGLATTQQVSISPPSSLGAHIWIGSTRVSSANTLAISFCGDATAGTPPSGNYIAVAF